MSRELYSYGVPVGVSTAKKTRVYADVYPSTPVVVWPKPEGQAILYWLLSGRRNPFSRWWVEIYSDLDGGSHHIDEDAGAFTFRGAVAKGMRGVEKVVNEIEESR